jgi:hypothetical protein
MYEYLSSIGFKSYKNNNSYKQLIKLALESPSEKYITNFGGDSIKVELIKYLTDRIGILIQGELDDQEEVIIDFIIPYFKGRYLSDTIEVNIEKISEINEYNVICEDTHTGIPLSFYLQNVIDYLDVEDKENIFIDGVRLVGFSQDGHIILPIEKDEVETLLEEEEELFRNELLKAAREGDQEALELLELEEEETAEIIDERLKNEDLLSIIDAYFMPYGIKGQEYAVLATIIDVDSVVNKITGEEVYLLGLKCLGLKFEITINKDYLIGVPEIGRRFKGVIWLQGHIEFSE